MSLPDDLNMTDAQLTKLCRTLDLALAAKDAEIAKLRAAVRQAVAYADVAAQMEGMPAGKQCKRLTATAIGDNPIATVVFDVAAARALLPALEQSMPQEEK
jgi:hypothetical protein